MKCRVCNSADRLAIEREIIEGKTHQAIGSRYRVSHDSVRRHVRHSPELRASAARDATRIRRVLDEVLEATVETFRAARREGKSVALLKAADSLIEQCELLLQRSNDERPENSMSEDEFESITLGVIELAAVNGRYRAAFFERIPGDASREMWLVLKSRLQAYPDLRREIHEEFAPKREQRLLTSGDAEPRDNI